MIIQIRWQSRKDISLILAKGYTINEPSDTGDGLHLRTQLISRVLINHFIIDSYDLPNRQYPVIVYSWQCYQRFDIYPTGAYTICFRGNESLQSSKSLAASQGPTSHR